MIMMMTDSSSWAFAGYTDVVNFLLLRYAFARLAHNGKGALARLHQKADMQHLISHNEAPL